MSRTFHIEFPATTLTVRGVWPDGDEPDNPTAEDVVRVMNETGGFYGVMRDWNMLDRLTVDGIEVR